MSILIPYEQILEQKINIRKLAYDLTIYSIPTKYCPYSKKIVAYKSFDCGAIVPYNYGITKGCSPPERKKFDAKVHNVELRDYQIDLYNKVMELFKTYRSALLSLHCGGGKTIIALYIMAKLHYKTLIIIERKTLIEVWTETLDTFFPKYTYCVVDSKTGLSKDVDIYIMSINIAENFPREDYNNIGYVIIDECHIVCTDNFVKGLLRFTPRVLLGLSATPERADGMDQVLYKFLGSEKVVKKLYVKHKIYRISTKFKPVIEKTEDGKLNWNSVLASQAMNSDRNQLIVRILRYFPERNWIVLCKTVEHATTLCKMLEEVGENVDYIARNKHKYNKDFRILCATYAKAGVGFNCPKLNSLLIASDVKGLIEQYHGRIVRREDADPIVIDIIDDFFVFYNHWKDRKKYYESCGGEVKDFEGQFPNFSLD
jgi:superfamily II DNA or RNA helicase